MILKATQHRLWSLAAAWALLGGTLCFGQSIPSEPALAADRWNFDSSLWDKAMKVGDFKVPTEEGKAPAAAREPTDVRLLHDNENLYVRYTAFDKAIDKLQARPLDEFADDFPQGDHGEIWATQRGVQVYAFDPHGNKYDACNYDSRFFSGFRVKSRVVADRWQCIVVIPLNKLGVKTGESVSLAFVRHWDHGDKEPERSTVDGQPATSRTAFKLN